ncbi:hypothetical protein QBZ16_005154 [Prototheca wickerhamii]|uniref:Mediator of RNA polymerase II transcription subunit 10 n=1 Tax=Prototheca wickerhamii TaxID=3111 RepID=A0AAD9IEM8_PROWI|nr:hypothetical protein QBZ16_005154 [Prototheca wickerhamii]
MAREVKAAIDGILLQARREEEYGASLQSLYELRDDLQAHDGTQLEVPVELLRSVDEGENPDAFTEAVFRSSLGANQACKGKVVAMRELHSAVERNLRETFPEEMSDYDALRSAAPKAE